MSDLIERQAVIEALNKVCEQICKYADEQDKWDDVCNDCRLDGAFSAITDLPSAQPERCEECEAFNKTRLLIPQRKKGKWIPCSERLPKQGQEVICQCRANIIKVLKLDADGDWYQDAEHCYMGGFVIAWMPLPEPYAERRTDEADNRKE